MRAFRCNTEALSAEPLPCHGISFLLNAPNCYYRTMTARKQFDGVRFDGGELEKVRDWLSVEEPIQININGKPFTITMRTPGDDPFLVKGLLFTEGVVTPGGLGYEFESHEDPKNPGNTIAEIQVPPIFVCDQLLEKRSLLSNASCGICGKRELDDIRRNELWTRAGCLRWRNECGQINPHSIIREAAMPPRCLRTRESFSCCSKTWAGTTRWTRRSDFFWIRNSWRLPTFYSSAGASHSKSFQKHFEPEFRILQRYRHRPPWRFRWRSNAGCRC